MITIETVRHALKVIPLRLIVKETGPGIKDENLNNIFLSFYSTKKGSGQNLGLGLSVSYGIIKNTTAKL